MSVHVLIVEDDESILELLEDMLRSVGYQVIGLRYPELVLDVVAHEKPDVILLDVMLPQRSGIEVADQLWTNGYGTIPIVAMSASTIMAELARQTPFFQDVVRKPFDMEPLLDSVDALLRDRDLVDSAPSLGIRS